MKAVFFTLMISTVTAIKRTEENESRHAPEAPEEELEIPASSMTPAPSMSPLPRLVAKRS